MRNDLCSHDGLRRAEKALRDEMEYEFSLVLKRFDVFWSKPVPRWPLGTLSMAWEPPDRQRPPRDRSEFAERHLPLAHLIERMVQQVIREELATSQGRSVEAMSFDQPTDDGSDFGEVGETLQEAREREERLLDSIDAGTSTEEMAYAKRDLPRGVVISAPTHDLVVDGNEVKCLDIRGAAQELGCSETTLRRYEKADKIRFTRQKGYRYLPERELDAARIELRRTGEWAAMLGVSKQTVRNWMRDIPSDTDPFERERLLQERAARKGKHRR